MDDTSTVTPGSPGAYNALKRELIGSLTGTVLEIGAGRGASLSLLRGADRLIGLEPSRPRRAALERASEGFGKPVQVIAGHAERIPLDEASVDAVLATIVLCSVRDQDRALAEVVRVLRPGGVFVFFEHVAPPRGTWSHRAARVWAPVSRTFDHGCDPTRRTWEALDRSDLAATNLRWFDLPVGFGLRMPYIGGEAVKA